MPIATSGSGINRCDMPPPPAFIPACLRCATASALPIGHLQSGGASSLSEPNAIALWTISVLRTSGHLIRALAGENELEHCAVFPVRIRSKLTAMALDDGSADGQPQSHSV